MKALRQQIALAAPTNSRVLIYGESGTGKELVAHALYAASLRGREPFVEVNCAAIPEELIESELFGHVKGSFTGASEDKIGKFEKADNGTLFLDEVGDMSLRTQAKVLRVLEEQRFERVGSNHPTAVNVRVIAATNKKLEEQIAKGLFREDLFYRLNVIPFTVPALRERVEDIPILARHFLTEFAAAYGRKPKEISDAALAVLAKYSWPGNVRELRNLIERLMITCPHSRIDPLHLPPELFRGVPTVASRPNATLHEARSAYEREFILRKLERKSMEYDANGHGPGPGAQPPVPQDEIAGNFRRGVDLLAAGSEPFELAAPVQLLHDAGVLAPVTIHFNAQFQEDLCAEDLFQLLASGRSDGFQLFASASDQDALLAVPFDGDAGTDAGKLLALLEGFHPHSHGVRHFLPGGGHRLFANDFGGQKSLGLIGDLIHREKWLSLREMRGELLQRNLHAVAGQSGDGNHLRKCKFTRASRKQRQ